MAQSRLITDLVELITPNNDDIFVIVDNTTNPSLSTTKRISYSSLKESLQDMIDVLVTGNASINSSYDDASNTITLSVVADTTVQKTVVSTGGTNVGTRQEVNFIAGSGITLTGADDAGNNRVDMTVTVNPSEISLADLSGAAPLTVDRGGTNATTAAGARTNLGAAKSGANSDIISISGLTTPLSISQGGTSADTALIALKNLQGLKYVTNVGTVGESLIVNDATLSVNEYRAEFKGIKAGSSKASVGTDGNDISIDVNADDVLSAATQNVDLNGFRVTNMAAPVGANDAATRAYVDQVSAGLTVKESVIASTTSSIAATYSGTPAFTLTVTGTGVPSLDGINVTATGTRVLIKDQTTASQNGIYSLTTAAGVGVSAVFTRTADYNSSIEVTAGTFTFVQSGATNGGKQFVQATATPTLDVDDLVFTLLNDATIPDGSITNAKLADMDASLIKGTVTSGTPQDLTADQVVGIVNSSVTLIDAAILPNASTSADGVVQLYDGVDSTSTTLAATANAVKTAYDEVATYAPSKTGVGASGTWNISISGNAATSTAADSVAWSGVTGTPTTVSGYGITDAVTATSTTTLTNKTLGDLKETVYTITDGASVDLDPANGPIQVWTIAANRTPTATNFAEGESMMLMVDDGAAYTITWPTMTWVGGAAPALAASGYTVMELWKVSTTLYGAQVGIVA